MADFDLGEWQRQQAAAAVAASQGQPNAIPNEPVITNAAARVTAPTGNGQVLLGSPGGSSVDALNRPGTDWGAPAAPNPVVDPAYAQRGLTSPNTIINPPGTAEGVGNYIDRSGNVIGPTHDEQGAPNSVPQGTVGVQGVVSPSERQFWANNQNGAIPHPVTGQLIGLGNDTASRQKVYQDLTPPDQVAGSTLPSPNFIPVPEVDPAVGARRSEIANEIANTQAQLSGASTARGRHGQPSSFDILSQKLGQLQHADSGLALHEHQQQQLISHATDQNRKMQDEYNVNKDASAANIAMGRITAAPGTDEYKAAMAQIDQQYPYARQDPRVSAAMLKAATFHDERADIAARAKAAGLTENIVGYGQKGPTIQYSEPAVANEKNMEEMNKELKTRGLPFNVGALFNPTGAGHKAQQADTPYNQLAPTDIINVPYTNKQGKADTAQVQKSTLETLKNDFSDRYKAAGGQFAQPPVAAPAPVFDPRIPLAQKALQDPNASEEHKAAARRILGIQ